MENHLIDVLVKPFGIQMAMSIYQGACHETFNFSLSVDSNHTGVQFGKVCNIQATVHQVALNAGIPVIAPDATTGELFGMLLFPIVSVPTEGVESVWI